MGAIKNNGDKKSVSVDQLIYAAEMSNRTAGNTDAAKVLQDIQKSPIRAPKVRKTVLVAQQMTTTKKRTPKKTLRIFVEVNLTKAQYDVIQKANKDVYPYYTLLQRVKLESVLDKSVVPNTDCTNM